MSQILSRMDTIETRIQEMHLILVPEVQDLSIVRYNQSVLSSLIERQTENNQNFDSTLSGLPTQVSIPDKAISVSSSSPRNIEYPSSSSTQVANRSLSSRSSILTYETQIMHPDFRTISETISPCIKPFSKVQRIAEELYDLFEKQDAHITNLRTLTFRKFTIEIPIIAWQEGPDTDVLAFCKYSDTDQPCSWLMHLGFGAPSRNLGSWNRASIRWRISDLAHLKELLASAQHILGLLQLSEDDLDRLCLENCKSSKERYPQSHI